MDQDFLRWYADAMARPERPNGPGRGPGRLPAAVTEARRQLARTLVARARVTYGFTTFAAAYAWIAAQEVWVQRWPAHGAPGERFVKEVWNAINPENVDLCANLENEQVNRTAAEERRAAIVRWRETVNRWYGIERELVVQRDYAADNGADAKELRSLEERLAGAQRERLAAERELAEATSVIDDESFDSTVLRSEVIAILARNRHHFTEDEARRVRAIFELVPVYDDEPDPDVPDYMQ